MTDLELTFDRLRPRLKDIAYHMLGSSTKAKEVVQDAWLTWIETEHATQENAEAWLVTVTTCLAMGRLMNATTTFEGMKMTEARLPWIKLAPKAYQAMVTVNADSTLDEGLAELVQTRVSQINGCAFCVDMHARDLRKLGETWQRINSLSTWREAAIYSKRERAALAWAETLTRLSGEHGDHDTAFSELSAYFTDKEIVELSWWIARINAWNRMAVGMRQPVDTAPIE